MKKIFLFATFAALAVVIAGCTSQTTQNNDTPNLDTFAQCITEKGVTMYGAPTCPYCLKQQEMFGDSFIHINYVDCTKDYERCANLRGVPAWELKDGTMIEGMQPLSALATMTDCTLPQ